MAFALYPPSKASMALLQTSLPSHGYRLFAGHAIPSNLVPPRRVPTTSTLAFSRRRNQNSATSSSSKKKKNKKDLLRKEDEEEDIDEDAFEALFSMLEEDLKNDELSVGDGNDEDDDDDIREEDIEQLQRELEEVLRVGNDEDVEMVNSAGEEIEIDDDAEDDDDEEEDERPVKIKNWQLRRLASALKTGRRKTSIKSLAAELCLDRAVVLELLREPPPNLVMMSAALPDDPAPVSLVPETKPLASVPVEATTVDTVKSGREEKVPIHVMRQRWMAQKRLKKVHVDTLERVYRRTKRPTNTMISSIVQVTNLPRKRVVKWFEDKRTEDGVPNRHLPYRRSVSESVPSS